MHGIATGHDASPAPQHPPRPAGGPGRDVRFESLQQDFDTVCDRLAKSRMHLPPANVGAHPDYHSYFDDECRTLFEQRFARDIAAFGYRY